MGKPNTGLKSDPRPINDKSFQQSCIRCLIGYLSTHGYDQPVSPKTLTSPMSKDFTSIVHFLMRMVCLDSNSSQLANNSWWWSDLAGLSDSLVREISSNSSHAIGSGYCGLIWWRKCLLCKTAIGKCNMSWLPASCWRTDVLPLLHSHNEQCWAQDRAQIHARTSCDIFFKYILWMP